MISIFVRIVGGNWEKMQVLINLTEHAYNNIKALDSISLGRCAYKGIVMSALNAIKRGTVINNANEDKESEKSI